MLPRADNRRRSAREKFSQCPYSYAAEYLHGVDSSSDATRRGDLFHAAREGYIRLLWQRRLSNDYLLAEQAWRAASVDRPVPISAWDDARDLWSRHIERFELNLETFYSVEAAMPSAFGADLRLDEVHVLDADTVRIIDAKTHWKIPSESILRDAFQTKFYLAAARKLFPGFGRIELAYDFVRYNQQLVFTMTPAELDLVEQFIEEQDEQMARAEEMAEFPARAGAHCGYCVLQCPLMTGLREPTQLKSYDEAKEYVLDLSALYRHTEHRREALDAFSDASGPVAANGIEWAHRPTTKTVYRAADVLNVLEHSNTEFTPMLSASAVKPLVTSKKKYLHIAESIKALGIAKVTTRFGPKRQEVADDARESDSDE